MAQASFQDRLVRNWRTKIMDAARIEIDNYKTIITTQIFQPQDMLNIK